MTTIRRGWLHLATGAGIGRIFGFISNLCLTRWLGPSELGLFNLVTTTVQTSDTLVRCGGDYALNFELGGQPESLKTEKGVHLARGLTQICSLMTVLICTVLTIWIWLGQGLFPASSVENRRWILFTYLILMIACECLCSSAWEVLLVSRRTASFALRQGLFLPLRLFFAAFGALFAGVLGAMGGWTLIVLTQCVWLKRVLGDLWNPLQLWPVSNNSVQLLLKRGLPFYGSNLLASIIFYPLLIKVATSSGIVEIGYLRVGQILQQLFSFIPATLVPVLFLRLRNEVTFQGQVILIEKPLRLIWFILIEILLLYCAFDHVFIPRIFGVDFASALLPTRLLLITALLESLSQLIVQPLLADGQTNLYGFWQNVSAIIAAALGWVWVPTAGLAAYLAVRLLHVCLPLLALGTPVFRQLAEPQKILPLFFVSVALLVDTTAQLFSNSESGWSSFVYMAGLIIIGFLHQQDLVLLVEASRTKS